MATALGLWVLGGTLLHLGPRDAWRGLDAIYYASPLPVLAAAAAGIGILCARHRRTLAVLGAAAAIGLGIATPLMSRYAGRPISQLPAAPPLRIAHWNIGRGSFGWQELPTTLASLDADVLCLSEARGLDAHRLDLSAAMPGYEWVFLRHGFCLAHRLGACSVRALPMPWGAAYEYRFEDAWRGQPLRIVATDLPGHPFSCRGPAIEALHAACEADLESPSILLGDFNTPRRSVWFDDLRGRFTHAFERAGQGAVETWPAPLPILDLDHVWCGPGVLPWRCEHRALTGSDHLAVIAELVLHAP